MLREPTATTGKRLLAPSDIRRTYGLSRQIAYALAKRLPHVRAGTRYLVRVDDLEAFLEQASREGADLVALIKNPAGAGGAE
ncbi:helix-turn-helix domain-containing protein [Meiothermus taiwanensis]|uniref:Helix-turn-helix domain-containing protein n=1 Tax=Meiothermus taiwanensis WR-220 TaxID=1339250 RepID=A0ABM6WFD5_9DEIN|nr:helix-turn-helix domain-containing protein [Meiothermus taiwanensis]AWR85665.1 hypothetical protein Mtai_v1c04170 [Meiothermus taiwanensis WR-220]